LASPQSRWWHTELLQVTNKGNRKPSQWSVELQRGSGCRAAWEVLPAEKSAKWLSGSLGGSAG